MRIIYTILIIILALLCVFLAGSFIYRMFVAPPVVSSIEQTIDNSVVKENIQIEVMNGTDINGLAATLTSYIRLRDFDVLDIGNWKSNDVETSFIYDRLGNRKASLNVAYALGISDSLVFTEIDSSYFLNCTVVIGKDYRKLKPFK